MTTGALLELVVVLAVSSLLCTCNLALAEPLQEIEIFKDNAHSPPSVELFIPLLTSAADSSGRYERAQPDDDAPFSNIPDGAFNLDDGIRVTADFAPLPKPEPAHGTAHKWHKSDDEKLDYYRPRSIYLGSTDQETKSERAPDVWRACQGLARERTGPAYEVLLLLCAELLDAQPATQHVAASSTPCTCCAGSEAPRRELSARRDYMPMGEDADMVLRHMRAPRRRRPHILSPPPWEGNVQD